MDGLDIFTTAAATVVADSHSAHCPTNLYSLVFVECRLFLLGRFFPFEGADSNNKTKQDYFSKEI